MAAPTYLARFGSRTSNFFLATANLSRLQRTHAFQTICYCNGYKSNRNYSKQWRGAAAPTVSLDRTRTDLGWQFREQSLRWLSTTTRLNYKQIQPRNNCISHLSPDESLRHVSRGDKLHPSLNALRGELSVRGYRSRRGTEYGAEEEVDADGSVSKRRTSGPTQAEKDDSAWMLRSSVENGYLSWVRNTYILTVAGVTMYNQIAVPFSQEAAIVLLLAGGINIVTGTTLYAYNILSRRRRMLMSAVTSVLLSGLATLHVLLWMGAIIVYLGYVEEDPMFMEEGLHNETEDRRNRRANKRISDKYD